jgi:leucyl-tRNA synthetase
VSRRIRRVLANEQVVNGGCWRCGTPVEIRELEQVVLPHHGLRRRAARRDGRDEALAEQVLTMQQNWIGRSEGARVTFPMEDASPTSKVFTTRIDTILRRHVRVARPEHPLVSTLAEQTPDPAAFRKQVQAFRTQDRAARISGEIEKQGSTPVPRDQPVHRQPVPIWVANFVLGDYGTGAVMAVPAHDQRDFEFARKFACRSGRHRARKARRRSDTMTEAADAYGTPSTRASSPALPRGRAEAHDRVAKRAASAKARCSTG